MSVKQLRREERMRLAGQPRVLMTREKAMECRYDKFFTGKPCKRGHIDFRKLKGGDCVACIKFRKYGI